MERALEAEGKAIPPQEDALTDTDTPVNDVPSPVLIATQTTRNALTASQRRSSDHKGELPSRPSIQRKETAATLTEQNTG